MRNLSQDKWRAQVFNDKNAVIIDVRTPAECASGILKNAVIIDFLQPIFFLKEVHKLDETKTYYIYSRNGNRSSKACEILEDIGFNESYNLMGGINEWNSEKIIPNDFS
jgi:rhodanese-related sulfurtransferase